MGILKLKRLLKNIAYGKKGNDAALDKEFRRISKQIPAENKRELIEQYGVDSAKRRSPPSKKEDEKGPNPQELAEEVHSWIDEFPPPSAVVPLREALEQANLSWIGVFRDAEGVSMLCGVMEGLADSRDLHLEECDSLNPLTVPGEEVETEEEVVRCLMVLFNKRMGLSTLEGSANLWPVIARSAMDSSSEYVRTNLLKALTVMVETGNNGLKVVLNALDIVKAQKNNDLRFSILVEALSSVKREDDSAYPVAVGVAVFLNTVLSSAFDFENRVLLRGEMIEAGMLQAIADARACLGFTADDLAELFEDSDSSDDDEASSGSTPPLQPPPPQQLEHLQQHTPTRPSGVGKKTLAEAQDVFISASSNGSTASIGASSYGTAFSTFSSAAAGGGAGTEAVRSPSSSIPSQLKRDLAAQLDLFDRVTDEDARDARMNSGITTTTSAHDRDDDGDDPSSLNDMDQEDDDDYYNSDDSYDDYDDDRDYAYIGENGEGRAGPDEDNSRGGGGAVGGFAGRKKPSSLVGDGPRASKGLSVSVTVPGQTLVQAKAEAEATQPSSARRSRTQQRSPVAVERSPVLSRSPAQRSPPPLPPRAAVAGRGAPGAGAGGRGSGLGGDRGSGVGGRGLGLVGKNENSSGLRGRRFQALMLDDDDDDDDGGGGGGGGGIGDGGVDSSESPKLSRGARSKRLVDMRGKMLDGRRAPPG